MLDQARTEPGCDWILFEKLSEGAWRTRCRYAVKSAMKRREARKWQCGMRFAGDDGSHGEASAHERV